MKIKNVLYKGTALLVGSIMLSGCGSQANEQGNSGGTVKLEFFNMKPEIVDILESLVSEYEASHQNVEIEINTPTNGPTVLSTRMASNDTPDIFTVWPKESFFEQVDSGFVMDLKDTGCLDNITEDARKQWVYNGGEYTVPISYNFGGIWYNKTIFDECEIQEFPDTWEGLMDACQVLKDKGYTPFVTAGQKTDQTVQQCYLSIGSSFSEEAYNTFLEDLLNKKVDTASPVYGAALTNLGDKLADISENSQSDILGYDDNAAVADFANGKGAMMIDGTWKLPSILDANPSMDCAIAAIPADSSEETRIAAYPGDFSISLAADLDGEEKKAAIEFVKWMASAETSQKYAQQDGSPSCVVGVDYVADQFSEVYSDYIGTGRFILNPDCKWNSAQITAIGAAVQQQYNEKDSQAFAENIKDALNNN